jgi:hypothetical protein
MDYKESNYHGLRNITEEIYAKWKKEGRNTYLPVEESKAINNRLSQAMIKAKREHIKNQLLSRIKSAEIIFNA